MSSRNYLQLHLGSCPIGIDFSGLLARYVKLMVAHAPGMPGTFFPPPRIRDPDMHHGTCVTHVPWCMPGSLTSGCLWSRWRENRSRYSRRMRNPQFYVSGKRPHVVARCCCLESNAIAKSSRLHCSSGIVHFLVKMLSSFECVFFTEIPPRPRTYYILSVRELDTSTSKFVAKSMLVSQADFSLDVDA